MKLRNGSINGTSVWTVKNDKEYDVSYHAREDPYPKYLGAFDKIIASISITNPVPQTKIDETPSRTGGKFIVYDDPELGMRIKYPANWVREKSGFRDVQDFSFSIRSTVTNSSPYGGGSVKIEIIPAKNRTLEEYTNEELSALKRYSYEINESTDYTLSSSPAHRAVMTNKVHDNVMEIWTVKNNTIYKIEYSANSDTYLEYLNQANEMIDSFTFTG
jgi:hypothetical protein